MTKQYFFIAIIGLSNTLFCMEEKYNKERKVNEIVNSKQSEEKKRLSSHNSKNKILKINLGLTEYSMEKKLTIKELTSQDYAFIKNHIDTNYGGEPLVIRTKKYYSKSLPGFVAVYDEKIVGFLLYEIINTNCEIIVFEVFEKFQGTGTQILDKLKSMARSKGCNRLFLMTTNDNLDALRFYQRRGFHISAIHIDSIKESRKIKPSIGFTGDHEIPLRDEIDLEMGL